MEFVLAWALSPLLAPLFASLPARPMVPMVPLEVKDAGEAGVVWRTLAKRWETR